MESKEKDIKEHYTKCLKAADYVDYLTNVYDNTPEVLRLTATFIYDVLKSGKSSHFSTSQYSNDIRAKVIDLWHLLVSNSLRKLVSMEKDIKDHYTKNLKAVNYVDYLIKAFEDAPELIRFVLTFMHDVLNSGRFGGASVLEIGSGSQVHNIASASAFYSNIIMSDYVEDNCNELKRWLEGKSSIKQFLDIPAKLEGYAGDLETGKKLIEVRIKSRVKHVVRCDVLLDGILMEKLPLNSSPPYDLIISSFTLEAAAPDTESYFQIYKRINKLLRHGGGLMVIGCLKGKLWTVKDVAYHHIEINQDELMNALNEAGFGEIHIKTQDKLPTDYQYEKAYCIAATKVK